jgi:hypothetical protein
MISSIPRLGWATALVLSARAGFAQDAAPVSAPRADAPAAQTPRADSAASAPAVAAPTAPPPPATAPTPPPAAPVTPAPAPSQPNPYYGYGAPAQQPDEVPPDSVQSEEDQPGKGLGSHQSHFMLGVGGRSMLVKDSGFDPFADSDGFAQFSAQLERTLFMQGNLSLAAMFGWDYGLRSSDVRGSATQLEVHRLALGPELRYHVIPRLFGFVRVAPALLDEHASLDDSLAGGSRISNNWVFGADATVGGAFELFGKRNGASHKPRFWVVAEGGYSWAAPGDLAFDDTANPDAAPVRMAGVSLGALSLSGPMFRVGAAVSFEP